MTASFHEIGIPLESLLEAPCHLIQVMTPQGDILYASTRWQQLTGCLPGTGNFYALLHPQTQAQVAGWLQHLRQGWPVERVECHLLRPDGTTLTTEGSLLPRLAGDALISVTVILHDLTERSHSYTELEHIFELSVDLLGILTFDGRFEKVNPAWQQVLGYTPAELTGRRFLDFVHPEDYERTVAEGERASRGRPTPNFENRYRCKDGSYRWLSWNTTSYMDEQRLYFVTRDVTQRKLIELELLLRNRALEASPSGISIADARQPDLPLIYINPAFERSTGYTQAEAIGRNCRFLQADDRDQPELEIIRRALRERDSCTVTLRNYRKDGDLFYNELRLAPIFDDHNELTHFVGISTDVTDREADRTWIESQNQALLQANQQLAGMRLETEKNARQIQAQNEALRQANAELAIARRQAEDAARLKTQFLATMSHELRTPLNAIIGYTEIQLAGMTGDLKPEQVDYQKRVLANADHLLSLINDVLDIARIEAGRLEILDKPLILRDWLAEVAAQTRGLAEDKGLRFETSLDERMPAVIIADSARLKQIVINLVSNAVKFTEQGFVKIDIRRHGRDTWKLMVSDSGIGIPSHLQETIFEEFRQVDSSFQRRQGGTGLGLAIVRKLTLMMGGNVRLTSKPGAGSLFTIFLPIVEERDAFIKKGRQHDQSGN
ncbi:MAG: PAS domain S-box protein [Anaerolineae bacterium]|nr:PAS domain S-box protein [Anaerolineae bacterium]